MSLATIIQKIDADAQAQCREMLAHAQTEEAQIVEHARQQSEHEAEHILLHAQHELDAEQKKRRATTLLHLRKERLEQRQKILETVFAKALERVSAHDAGQRRAMIKTMLLSVAEERGGTIRPSPADSDVLTPALVDDVNQELRARQRALTFALDSNPANIAHGFIVDFNEFEVNYSFETLFAGIWNEVKSAVSKQLFEQTPEEE